VKKLSGGKFFGFMAGYLEIKGDIIEPIDEDWDADQLFTIDPSMT